jgi:predicted metalloprotease with PDZ domain
LKDDGASTLRLIAHEHAHLWNGKLMRPEKSRPEGYYKWFQEGLTEYYAWKTLLGSALITPEQFAASVNDAYRQLQTNPYALTATAQVLADHYWDNGDYTQLPYEKGVAAGFLLDATLAKQGGLDRVMREMKGERSYDEDTIEEALVRAGGQQMRDLSKRSLFGAEALPYESMGAKMGVHVERVSAPIYDLGVTIVDKVIRSVTPGSNAAKAGLRPGETVAGYSYYSGDPHREAVIKVMRGGKVVPVAFTPAREAEIVQIRPTASTLAVIEALRRE